MEDDSRHFILFLEKLKTHLFHNSFPPDVVCIHPIEGYLKTDISLAPLTSSLSNVLQFALV